MHMKYFTAVIVSHKVVCTFTTKLCLAALQGHWYS